MKLKRKNSARCVRGVPLAAAVHAIARPAPQTRYSDRMTTATPRADRAEKQAASGLAKMGLVDPSLRRRSTARAVAKKAQRFYNSVVHGVPDKKAEQQETANMTQSAFPRRNLNFDDVAVFTPPRRRRRDRTSVDASRASLASMASMARPRGVVASRTPSSSYKPTQVHHAPPEDEDGHL